MTDEQNDLIKSLDKYSKSARHLNVFAHDAIRTIEVLRPKHWEDLRQFIQQRVREATGEPHLIVHFEIPKGEM